MYEKNSNFYAKKMHKSRILIIKFILVAVFLCGCVKKDQMGISLEQLQTEETGGRQEPADRTEEQKAAGEQAESVSGEAYEAEAVSFLYVHICGAVKNPGVYELPEGSRVFEAVAAAGGFLEEADTDYVNQAQFLPDEGKIVIPTRKETELLAQEEEGESGFGIILQETRQEPGGVKQNAGGEPMVNLNTAGKEELCSLPGIGTAKAEAIIRYREKKGSFLAKEELKQVEGIKEGVYTGVENRIYVE